MILISHLILRVMLSFVGFVYLMKGLLCCIFFNYCSLYIYSANRNLEFFIFIHTHTHTHVFLSSVLAVTFFSRKMAHVVVMSVSGCVHKYDTSM